MYKGIQSILIIIITYYYYFITITLGGSLYSKIINSTPATPYPPR